MLPEKLAEYSIILASKSPRRHYLLKKIGLKFTISDLHSVDEIFPKGLNKFEIPVYLSNLKSEAFKPKLKDKEILITADTIVWLNNELIGKPKNRDHALEILKKLRGNMHEVITGVTLKNSNEKRSFYAQSEVYFSMLSDQELEYYVDNFKPFDKAGAYGIQDWIGFIGIEEIRGSYFNVMGLPIQRLYRELENFISK